MSLRNRFARLAIPAALVAILTSAFPAQAGNDGVVPQHNQPKGFRPEARIDEQVGAQIQMDLVFRDENDQPITIGDAIGGKPTILVPVYYRCPMLCTRVLNGVLEACRQMPPSYSIGSQFHVVTVSMDPKEHGDLARPKKEAYVSEYGRPGAEKGWRFLTGTKENIGALLDTVGYRFEFDKMLKEYNHPSGIIILTPGGKVTRYFYGIGYDSEYEMLTESAAWQGKGKPELTESELRERTTGLRKFTKPTTTLRLSLIEANDGHGGSLLDKITMLCYRYDQLSQSYTSNLVLWVVRIGGITTLTLLVGGLFFAFRRERRRKPAATVTANDAQPPLPNGAGGTT